MQRMAFAFWPPALGCVEVVHPGGVLLGKEGNNPSATLEQVVFLLQLQQALSLCRDRIILDRRS